MLLSLPVEAEEMTPRFQLLNLSRILGWEELCHIYVGALVQLLRNFAQDPVSDHRIVIHPPNVVSVALILKCLEVLDSKSRHKAI